MTVTVTDIEAAAARIQPWLHRTPVMSSTGLNELAGARIVFKCEHLQKTGSFKARGATNVVRQLTEAGNTRGVATHSSGNHGAALAWAAAAAGIPATIVVPENAPATKVANIRRSGARIIFCESTLEARVAALNAVVSETGATFVSPYDEDGIIAGQGTAALEFLQQSPDMQFLLVPVGGGGLLAGSAIAAAGRVAVYGTEPEMADDAFRSFTTGVRVTNHTPDTIADGLQTTLGERNFGIIKEHVAAILLVSEDQIREAMMLVWQYLKQVIEPSSAVPLAALLANRDRFAGSDCGIILSGGNRDFPA
ncbi:MAG: pyridoxal-phosphate dependent enzyme [Pseudomonadales bacterium]|nr:pyridoxal-phosphate dependent enzyme [Pseudomonadales bacterium]